MAAATQPAIDRRNSLIEACARVLAQQGATGASVRTICAAAGVSPGLLRHYFAGIDDLVAATYLHVGAQVGDALDAAVAAAGPDDRARLDAYVVASFRPPIADPDLLATWLAFWSLVKTSPAIAAIHADLYADYRARLADLLGACGVAPADRRLAAIALTALVDGLWLEISLDPTTFDRAEAMRMAIRWVDATLETPRF